METVVKPFTQSYNQGHSYNRNLKFLSKSLCVVHCSIKGGRLLLRCGTFIIFQFGTKYHVYKAPLNFISSNHSANTLVPTMWTSLEEMYTWQCSIFCLSSKSFIHTIHLNMGHRAGKDIITVGWKHWIKDQRAEVDFLSKLSLKSFFAFPDSEVRPEAGVGSHLDSLAIPLNW